MFHFNLSWNIARSIQQFIQTTAADIQICIEVAEGLYAVKAFQVKVHLWATTNSLGDYPVRKWTGCKIHRITPLAISVREYCVLTQLSHGWKRPKKSASHEAYCFTRDSASHSESPLRCISWWIGWHGVVRLSGKRDIVKILFNSTAIIVGRWFARLIWFDDVNFDDSAHFISGIRRQCLIILETLPYVICSFDGTLH